jgi:hypothetical protein
VNASFTPEQVITLGKALDQLIEKYGPFDDEQKSVLAERLLRLGEQGIWDFDRLVEKARLE